MSVRIALPKGRLLTGTASLLARAGWKLDGYNEELRNYRLKSGLFPDLQAKVFQEKDIPVQVTIGNYDLGICGLDWIEELRSKYAASAPVKIKDLGYGRGSLYITASRQGNVASLDDLRSRDEVVRIASEYPNIAESFALNQRWRRFSIYPVWGGADAYPPESATLALVTGNSDAGTFTNGIFPISDVLNFSAFLIANRQSWEQKDLSEILATLENVPPEPPTTSPVPQKQTAYTIQTQTEDTIRFALPDGHQQKPTIALLNRAGIQVDDYPSLTGNRRPGISLDGIAVKVIRPQDMPLQVASGNFDLAITGHDWLTDHLAMFPSSPVKKLTELKTGRVRIVAVVCDDVPANNVGELREMCRRADTPIRIASEYTNLADKYARDNQLGMYRIIPTWGATEAFLPEDADLLIENTETGSTIARHNLKIIDTLFESTACLIGVKNSFNRQKQDKINRLVAMLDKAVD